MNYVAPSRRPRANRRRSAVLCDALEPRALFTATPTTTTLTSSAPLLSYGQPVTLTATVTEDAHAPVPTGTVAFIEPLPASSTLPLPSGRFPNVLFQDPATHAYKLVQLIGTAPLASDGTAYLTLSSLDLSTRNAQAVFLGSSPVLATNISYFITSTTFPSYVSGFGLATGSTLVLPHDKYLQITPNSNTSLNANFTDSVPDYASLVTPGPDGLSYHDLRDSFYMSALVLPPSDTPYLLVNTPWTTQEYNYYYGSYTATHFDLSVTPFAGLPASPNQNDAYRTSLSTNLSIAPGQPTSLHLSTSGPFTYTNPPAITVSLTTPAGISYSRHAPDPTPRGDYHQAHAGLDVQVSTGGTNAYAGGSSTSGAVLHFGGNPTPPFVPSGPFPTGTVSFYDENNTLLGTAPLDADGNATFYPDPRSLSLDGSHSIHAVYAGDANYQAADASTPSFTLTRAATLISSGGSLPATVYSDTTLHLQGIVSTVWRDTVTPTGTLTFSVDGQTVTTLPALAGLPSASDPTSPAIPLTLTSGTHTLVISYSGDADCLPSSTTLTFAVLARPTPPPAYIPPTYNPPFGTGTITDVSPASLTPNYSPIFVNGHPVSGYLAGTFVSFDASVLYTGTGRPGIPVPSLAFALSLDDVAGNADDIPLGAHAYTGTIGFVAFDSDGHATFSYSYGGHLPADLAPGDYHIVATADPDNSRAETDETNNSLVSSWTIAVLAQSEVFTPAPSQPTPVLITPDLTGTLTPAHPTATVNAPASLKLTLTNPSKTKTVARKYAVTYYLSTDATFSSDDTKFSRQVINVNLDKKQTKSYALNYKLPTTAPLGTRYLIAVADLADSLPSITSGVTVASSKPLKILGPHLAATVRSVTPTNRPDTVKVTVRVLNDGSATFAGPATLRLLSDTPTADTLLLTARKSVTLKAGKYADYTFTLRRPAAGATLSVTVA